MPRSCVALIALVWAGCAGPQAPTTRAAPCRQPASAPPPGWVVSENDAVHAAETYVLEHGYTSTPARPDALRKEMADANVPEADVPMVLHVQMRDRFNKVLPRAIGIRRVHEWGRDVWAVIFPLTEDYLRQHPDSTGYGREVHVSSDGGEIYVPEFEADPSRADALCAEPLAR